MSIHSTGPMVLYSFSQDPRVPSNQNPIYAPGSPQFLAAVASGANPTAPSYTAAQIAAGAPNVPYGPPVMVTTTNPGAANIFGPGVTWSGDCNNPVINTPQGQNDYIKACYPSSPLAQFLNGGGTAATTPPSLTIAPTLAQAPSNSMLSAVPTWGWAALGIGTLFLFSRRH